jgi:hypothetical protein
MLMPSHRSLFVAAVSGFAATLLLTPAAAAIDPAKLPPAAKTPGVTFAKDIKPLFEKSCFKCHGAEKQKGKLRLDTLEATLKGGENAPNIVPGDSAKSTLVAAIARAGDEDDFMPPKDKGEPFTKEQVGLVRAWIDQGAK